VSVGLTHDIPTEKSVDRIMAEAVTLIHQRLTGMLAP
jgi:hypothetical protein